MEEGTRVQLINGFGLTTTGLILCSFLLEDVSTMLGCSPWHRHLVKDYTPRKCHANASVVNNAMMAHISSFTYLTARDLRPVQRVYGSFSDHCTGRKQDGNWNISVIRFLVPDVKLDATGCLVPIQSAFSLRQSISRINDTLFLSVQNISVHCGQRG